MRDAVIVDAVRTPVGRRSGKLSGWHPAELTAEVLRSLQVRNDLDPALVDDVVTGCVMQIGAQSLNVGRTAVLAADWPESVPATTIDRQCGSGQQAVHVAAQGVMAGVYDLVVAAGVEVMSLVPPGASIGQGVGEPFGPAVNERYEGRGGLLPQGLSAELVAEQWRLDRDELDAYAMQSFRRARQAAAEGRFGRELVAVPERRLGRNGQVTRGGGSVTEDETVGDPTPEELAGLKPTFTAGGRITAGNTAQIADGAAAVLIASEQRAAQLGLRARARFAGFSVAAVDPVLMLTGAVPATRRVLERTGHTIDAVDLIEVHEAFAAVVLAWERETGADRARVNVNGGAIALGHPLGCSGTRMLATLLCELERAGGRLGLQTMGGSGGTANALLIERLG